ncbi:MAG: exodeoxyribonuclease VII large subunit [Balneolales bacterium]
MEFLNEIPTVSQLTFKIKTVIEEQFYDVLVQGEVSQPTTSRNGHIYFTLKDSSAQLPCVIWKSTVERNNIMLEHGQHVMIGGELQLYAPHGKYQLIVSAVQQAGAGALQQAFEKLKGRLQAEGLFEEERKRKLPRFPKKIGVVTSSTGAAFQDIVSTLTKRYPLVELFLYHASVQGLSAASEIATGIEYFSSTKSVDIMIIGRGGGSIEDLWPFNEEVVARAIYKSHVPVISAVGHETDFSISDFTADVRAATPTQAASIAVPDITDLRYHVEDLDKCLGEAIKYQLKRRKDKVDYYLNNHALLKVREKASHLNGQVSSLNHQLTSSIRYKYLRFCEHFTTLENRLSRINPNEALNKGFTRIIQGDGWVKTASKFDETQSFKIQWGDGKAEVPRRS